MTSHDPGQCCFVAYKHEGVAQGSIEKIGGINAYIARPKSGNTEHGIVLFPDFFGYELINTKLVADQLAKNGYLTVIPDVWEGDNVPLDWEPTSTFPLGPWFGKHGSDRVVPIADTVIRSMRDEDGVKKLGGVGHCLGAKYVCQLMVEGKGLDVGFFAHPTAVTPEEVNGVAGPLSVAAAGEASRKSLLAVTGADAPVETDHLFPAEKRHETEEILRGMHIAYQINLYSDVEHGFALKADMSKKRVKFAAETAFLQAVNWFDHYLKAVWSLHAVLNKKEGEVLKTRARLRFELWNSKNSQHCAHGRSP